MTFQPDELDLLQGLADQAAIAITNSNLLEPPRPSPRPATATSSQNSPDLVWSIDADGQLVVPDRRARAADRLGGRRAARQALRRRSSTRLSREVAEFATSPSHGTTTDVGLRGRVNCSRGTASRSRPSSSPVASRARTAGSPAPTAPSATSREQTRLERELRESEERYRFLVENSPDVVFATDAEGNFTYMSETIERSPARAGGGHRRATSRPRRVAAELDVPDRWAKLVADPASEQISSIMLKAPTAGSSPSRSAPSAIRRDGGFAGIHGSTRDITERERLERELRVSEERYRYLVASSPDLVWLTDDQGVFTFVSDATPDDDRCQPAELIGRPFSKVFDPAAAATRRPRPLAGSPPSAVHRMGCRSATTTATTSPSRSAGSA